MKNLYWSGLVVFVFVVLTSIGSLSYSQADAAMAVGSSGGDKCTCERSKRYDSNGLPICNVLTRYEWKDGCCTKIERYWDNKQGKIVEEETCYPDITEEECGYLTGCKKHNTAN